jgi:hypothetical protein
LNDLLDMDSALVKTPGGKHAMGVSNVDTPLDVLPQDDHAFAVQAYLVREISSTTLAADLPIDSASVTVAAGHGFTVGDVFVIQGYFQSRVIAVNTNVLTLNQRSNAAYSSGTAVKRTQSNMNVNGSSTPVVFGLESVAGRKFDLYSLKMAFRGTADMDDAKFASLTALSKGVIFRARFSPMRYNNYFNARDNTEFHLRGTLTYNAKAPSGSYGSIFTFNLKDDHGVALRLDYDAGTRIEVIVQDDLSALTFMAATVAGHVVED